MYKKILKYGFFNSIIQQIKYDAKNKATKTNLEFKRIFEIILISLRS